MAKKKSTRKKTSTVARKVDSTSSKKTARKKKSTTQRSKERWGKRDDLGAAVDHYLSELPADLNAEGQRLHEMFMELAPNADAAIKWGMPVYSIGTVMAGSIWKGKGYLRLGLYSGAGLRDPQGLLAGEGKQHRHVRIVPGETRWSAVEKLMQQSVALAKRANASD
jgi:hypothetical protein